MRLAELIDELRHFPGVVRKQALGPCLRAMQGAWDFDGVVQGPGDDAAVLKAEDGGYLLLAADGILSSLVRSDPERAGRAAVLVNVNDIYAMGGRPLALVNVLAGVDEVQVEAIARGVRRECRRLRVPMVGGHISPEGDTPFLAAGVLGRARALLSDRNAKPGEQILLAVDLRGQRWGEGLLNWDSHANKDARTLAGDLSILCCLAEEGLCSAAKDVSNGGILGSLGMLLESAGLGAEVELDRIEVPDSFRPVDWLKVYPSYGFLLACSAEVVPTVLERFAARGIWADRIGRLTGGGKLRLRWKGEEGVLFDFTGAPVFGLGAGKGGE